jgi:hypothetical protein
VRGSWRAERGIIADVGVDARAGWLVVASVLAGCDQLFGLLEVPDAAIDSAGRTLYFMRSGRLMVAAR